MKRGLIVLFTIWFIILSVADVCAYQITSYSVYDHTRVVSDGDSVYLISYSDTSLSVDGIVPDDGGAQLTLRYPVTTAGVFNGTLVALCNDHKGDQLVVYTYDIAGDVLDSFCINQVYVHTDSDFYYDGSLYLVDASDTASVIRYSSGGKLKCRYAFGDNVMGMIHRGNRLYVVSADRLYRLSGDTIVAIDGARVSSPLSFVDNSTLSDAQGRIYTLSGDSIRLSMTIDSGGLCSSACRIDDHLYYPQGNTVYCYDASGSKTAYLTLNSDIIGVYAFEGSINVLDDTFCVSRIMPSEFIPLITPTEEDDSDAEHAAPRVRGRIGSETYTVDFDTMRIAGIPSPTTFAVFKKNMSYDGYSVRLFRDGRELSGGRVGTAMCAVFESDSDSLTFELSVVGDITGEGNVNSRDLTELMEYLVGSLYFDGVYAMAADLSDDGAVDALDLAMLKREIA